MNSRRSKSFARGLVMAMLGLVMISMVLSIIRI